MPLALRRFSQAAQKALPIRVGEKAVRAIIAALDCMLRDVGYVDVGKPGHAACSRGEQDTCIGYRQDAGQEFSSAIRGGWDGHQGCESEPNPLL